jgi:E3 ubiquitin-protein ligase makorin
MEPVGKKKDPRFGLLECEHCACLECIREWRGLESMKMSKSCPICRTVTFFVTPSTAWPSSVQEKSRMILEYKQKLSKIDCKHYNFGDGSCPFGTSCFYKHADQHGIVSATEKPRHIISEDETATIFTGMRLSDFIK